MNIDKKNVTFAKKYFGNQALKLNNKEINIQKIEEKEIKKEKIM